MDFGSCLSLCDRLLQELALRKLNAQLIGEETLGQRCESVAQNLDRF
jgi:hypothetical protein